MYQEGDDSISRFKKPSLNPQIRPHVEYLLEHYPESCKDLENARLSCMPRMIQSYDTLEGSGSMRPTENAALQLVSFEYISQLTISTAAIRSVVERLSPEDLALIRLMYWSGGQLTAEGVALRLHMNKSTLYAHINVILIEIARRLGYINIFDH